MVDGGLQPNDLIPLLLGETFDIRSRMFRVRASTPQAYSYTQHQTCISLWNLLVIFLKTSLDPVHFYLLL